LCLKKTPIIGGVAQRIYWHLLYLGGDRRPLLRAQLIRRLKRYAEFVEKNHLVGGLLANDGDYYLRTPDDLFLYYNYNNKHLTWGDGQGLEGVSEYAQAPAELFVLQVMQEGGVYVDVGANSGYFYALKVAAKYPTAKVLAFEPDPKILHHLERNVAVNNLPNISIFRIALSERPGRMQMTADLGASNYLVDTASANWGAGTIEVEAQTMDQFAEAHGLLEIKLIKVDIEGHELGFLRGATATVQKMKPILLMELNEQLLNRAGASLGEVLSLLESWRYRCFMVAGSHDAIAFHESRMVVFPDRGNEWLRPLHS
jgi:FkbM family methyltransferase